MTEVIIWNGWLGGAAIGLLLLSQLVVSGRLLSVSTGFGNFCSFFSRMKFFHSGDYENPNNWRLWFLLGIPLGGLLAAITSGHDIVPSFSMGQMYDAVLPASLWLKASVVLLGGIMIGYGARLAGGCTCGHSISGVALVNRASILASIGFFFGGINIIHFLFKFLH